jgi:hypothetical protein
VIVVQKRFQAPASSVPGHEWNARRLEAIHHAQLWKATDVGAMDMRAGPQASPAFKPNETVKCDFIRRPHGSGSTLKFACAGCPADPFNDPVAAPRLQVTTFDPATIDFKVEGDTIETKPDEGWSWDELALVDEHAGGAPRPQRDALTLLAVLIQHSSNKSINQRIVCVDPPSCSHTVMMISDLGKTFGRANAFNKDARASVNFAEWSRQPVWNGTTGCVGDLPRSWTGTLHDPQITEAGRKFLADLLAQLTDQQLHDLFDVARFTERDPSATIDDWVNTFKRKRAEIADRHCDS